MAGRESEYMRGFLTGVGSMLALVKSGQVEQLDNTNIMEYSRQVMRREMELERAPRN